MENKTALVAMSGGVDSSAAAIMIKDLGFTAEACIMRLYGLNEVDIADARSAAGALDMPFHVFDFTDCFKARVIDDFTSSYEQGRTPNPCFMCNRFLKFGKLLDAADELGLHFLATGHYARVVYEDGLYKLKKALDPSKDQSYFLSCLSQDVLSRVMFPLGDLTKEDAKKTAYAHGLKNASRSESQDICFVPDGDYASVIESLTGKAYPEGDFIDTNGSVLGRHKGIIRYTVGQRRGLGISSDAPLYVLSINPSDNTVTLGRDDELFSCRASAAMFNWTLGAPPSSDITCKARIRYRQTEQPCTAHINFDNSVDVLFDEPLRAITPGQTLVLYDGDTVLGGGAITGNAI